MLCVRESDGLNESSIIIYYRYHDTPTGLPCAKLNYSTTLKKKTVFLVHGGGADDSLLL